MAKSLRSKWKRKMKAVKRERYAAKELKQLKKVLENVEKKDMDMSDICTVTTKESITAKRNENLGESSQAGTSEGMDVDKASPKYHPVRLTNEHGNYPVWMNQRAARKHKAKLRRYGKLKGKGKKK